MKHPHELNAPWSLHFDSDGTEDIAIICDSNGEDLASSRDFWLPEGDDDIPPTLAGFWLMVQAPRLLDALYSLLRQTVDRKIRQGIPLTKAEQTARSKALAVIAKVNGE